MSDRPICVNATAAEWIQIAFPEEPEWSSLSAEILIALVRDHDSEPSCAAMALSELIKRQHPRARELCIFLIHADMPDEYLNAHAVGKLLSLDPLEGFTQAMPLLENEDVLSEVLVTLGYEDQGSLSEALHQHPIVPMVRKIIVERGQDEVEYAEYFAIHFGLD